MAKDKYTVEESRMEGQAHLLKDGKIIAKFWNDVPNNKTNAQKVCDLLNETSRSQGKVMRIVKDGMPE